MDDGFEVTWILHDVDPFIDQELWIVVDDFPLFMRGVSPCVHFGLV